MGSYTVVVYYYFISFALVFRRATCAVVLIPTAADSSLPNTKRELFSNRIVGGTEASPGEFPFFVQWAGRCGASLIWHDIILSAAQCNAIAANNVIVGAFQENVTTNTFARKITTRKVHPLFNYSAISYDFLVMKLDKEVPVSTTPVSLNGNMSYPINNQLLTTIDFGATFFNGAAPTILLKVKVPVVETQVCSDGYNGSINGMVHLCAGSSGKDSCQGDAGGPLLDSNNVQVGIVSFGIGCGRPGFPGVYSRISAAIDWINQQICDLSANPPTSCPEKVPTTPPTLAPTRVPTSSKPTVRAPAAPHRTSTKPTSKPTSKPVQKPSKPVKPVRPTSKPVKKPSKPVKPSPKPVKPVSSVKPV